MCVFVFNGLTNSYIKLNWVKKQSVKPFFYCNCYGCFKCSSKSLQQPYNGNHYGANGRLSQLRLDASVLAWQQLGQKADGAGGVELHGVPLEHREKRVRTRAKDT